VPGFAISPSPNRLSASSGRRWRVVCAAVASLALAGTNSLVSAAPAWANSFEVIDTISVGNSPRGVAVSPDGTFAYVVNSSGHSVSVVQTSDNTVTQTIELGFEGGVGHFPLAVAFLPDGSAAYVANSGTADVDVIRTSDHTVSATVSIPDLGTGGDPNPTGLAVTPDGSKVYVREIGEFSARVIQTSDNSLSQIALGASPNFFAATPDGGSIYVGFSNRTLRIIDTSDNSLSSVVSLSSSTMRGMAFSPDGSTGYIPNATEGTVSVIQTSDDTVSETITLSTGVEAIDISPDGSLLYVSNRSVDTVSVIQTSDNSVVETINVGDFPDDLAVSPDGSRVYVTNKGDNTVSVIAVTSSGSSEGSSSGSGSDSRASSVEGVPGIFLTVLREQRSLASATEVKFGAFSIQSDSPYIVSIRSGDNLGNQRVLASGTASSGGHLERSITLPALPRGAHTVILSAYDTAGARLILGNTITVDSTGEITSVTPESRQPNIR